MCVHGPAYVFVWEFAGIISCICAKVSAKLLGSSKANSGTKQRFHSPVYFKGKKPNQNYFQERRHRCSALKNKGTERNIPLADWPVSKYLADWYPHTCWWTKSRNTSPERQWEFCLAFLLAVISGCPAVFSLEGLGEKILALPLPDSGSKMRKKFRWLFISQV